MSTKVSKPESKDWPQAPEGLWQAVCVDVWDVWTEQRPEAFGGGLTDKTRIVWEINKQDKENNRPHQVSMIYTASLHDKATLRKHLEAWRGRRFTEDELKEFELEKLLGANCQLQVIHHLSGNGKVYANVQAIVPLGQGTTKMRASTDFVRRKDRKAAETQAPKAAGEPGEDDVPF